MRTYKVQDHELNGGELDTFHKLHWHGPQDDGGLPSKGGMAGLIEKGLAVKDYDNRPPNRLSATGESVARTYYRQEFRDLQARLQRYRLIRIVYAKRKKCLTVSLRPQWWGLERGDMGGDIAVTFMGLRIHRKVAGGGLFA